MPAQHKLRRHFVVSAPFRDAYVMIHTTVYSKSYHFISIKPRNIDPCLPAYQAAIILQRTN